MHDFPFCPNPSCPYHRTPPDEMRWYVKNGHYQNKALGDQQRFICKHCRKSFSLRSFSIDYFVKKPLPYRDIFLSLISASGIRDIGRQLMVHHKTVLNRISRLARQAIGVHSFLLGDIRLQEDLTTDGFESFTYSKYFPCNIHLLVGVESQFFYAADYAHLKRKGKMRKEQREKRDELEKKVRGRVSITTSFTAISEEVERLLETSPERNTVLRSDQKKEYERVIQESVLLAEKASQGLFTHKQYSSKTARTKSNPLFSVNYLDRQFRKSLAEHARKTLKWGKNCIACMQRIAVYRLYHNYMKSYRIESHDKKKQRKVHGEPAGIAREKISEVLEDIFERRIFLSRIKISFSEAKVWIGGLVTPTRHLGGYWPTYIWD